MLKRHGLHFVEVIVVAADRGGRGGPGPRARYGCWGHAVHDDGGPPAACGRPSRTGHATGHATRGCVARRAGASLTGEVWGAAGLILQGRALGLAGAAEPLVAGL